MPINLGRTAFETTQFGLDVVRGEFPEFSFINKFGRNGEIDIANDEDIWSPGNTWSPLSAAATASIVSSNVNDISAGTGARTIFIEGLDLNFDQISETVIMNGTIAVITANSYIRIHRMLVLTAGNSAENEGDITATVSSTIQALIPVGLNQTFQCIFTIPNNRIGYILQIYASVTNKKTATGVKEGNLTLFSRREGGVFQGVFDIGLNSRAGPFALDLQFPALTLGGIPGKTDLKFRFKAHNNNCKVSAAFAILLEDIS